MRKHGIILGILSLSIGLLCGCGKQDDKVLEKQLQQARTDAATTWETVAQEGQQGISGILRIGCDEYEPYNYVNENGKIVGIDADIAREACRRLGMEAEITVIPWSEKDALLEQGKIDCIWSCYAMLGREDSYRWTSPYLYSREVIVVRKNSTFYTATDLNGRVIAAQTGTKPEKILLEETGENIPLMPTVYSFPSMEEVLIALQQGYADAAVGHEATIEHYANHLPSEYRILSQKMTVTDLGVAFDKNNQTPLVEQLSDVFEEMKEDGSITSILKKYGVNQKEALIGGESR